MAARRYRRRFRPLAWSAAIVLGLAVPEAALSSPSTAALNWWKARRSPVAHADPMAAPPRTLTQPGFESMWADVKTAMAPCDRAFALAAMRRQASAASPRPAEAASARERCAGAIVDVGAVPLPPTDQAGVRRLLEQARDGCQRSMAEKQMAVAAMHAATLASPDSLDAYEAQLRIAAGPRSGLNCAAGFAAAARAARLRFAELELAAGEPV